MLYNNAQGDILYYYELKKKCSYSFCQLVYFDII